MKVYIRQSATSNSGYELVTIDDQNNEVVQAIDKTYPNEPFTLVLPTNESNRKYFNSKKVDAAGGSIELTYKESKTFGPRGESSPRKALSDYLTDDERATIERLMTVAKERRAEATKKVPLTPIEKARRTAERAQARYEALLTKGE